MDLLRSTNVRNKELYATLLSLAVLSFIAGMAAGLLLLQL